MQTNLMQYAAYGLSTDRLERPDFAELDVFLGQHILLTLEQHFNLKM